MYQRIVKIIEMYGREQGILQEGRGIVVGLSGGADSALLLFALRELREKWQLRLCAVHVNHGIRGEEAVRDESAAVCLAEELGVPSRVFRGDVPALAARERLGLEEAGRNFRYQCLEQVREELEYDDIAVGHHRDDQAETILFQMLRGSGVRGMGGMRPRRGRIIRPLLCVGKEEILRALEERQIGFCQDSTNGDIRYSRNKIRREILPRLEEVQPGAIAHIARLGQEMQALGEYLEREADRHYRKLVRGTEGGLRVDAEAFLALDQVVQRELIMRMMAEVGGCRRDISAVHVDRLREIFAGGTGRRISLPYGMQGWREYGDCCLEREPSGEDADGPVEELVLGREVSFVDSLGEPWTVRAERESAEGLARRAGKKYCTKCFDYDRMNTMPGFRRWKPGDYLWLDREGHRKKLSRIFVDEKIPSRRRRRVLVLAEGSHVLWIPELGRESAYYYLSEETQEALCVYKIDKQSKAFSDIQERKEKGGII